MTVRRLNCAGKGFVLAENTETITLTYTLLDKELYILTFVQPVDLKQKFFRSIVFPAQSADRPILRVFYATLGRKAARKPVGRALLHCA
jgi:hypothetical protein